MKYAYDALDRLQSSTDALGRITSYQYDAASNLTQRTDARGLITRYFPDDLNRVDLVQHCTAGAPPGQCTGSYLVDSVDYTYNEVGFRTQLLDSTGLSVYTPDALERLTSVTTNSGTPGAKTVSYTYDSPDGIAAPYPGQRTRITYPDGKTVNYTYEKDGRMRSVTDWLAKQTVYNYDDAGRLTTTLYPNTICAAYGYDAADRLTSVMNRRMAAPPVCSPGDTVVSSFTYSLDAVGNRQEMVDSSGTHGYQYDDLYRLRQASYPGGPIDNYTYDHNGNRLMENSTTYKYDAGDQMTWDGVRAYGYDANGNQTGRGSDVFSYDHENRLTKIVLPKHRGS